MPRKKMTPQQAKAALMADGVTFQEDFHALGSSEIGRLGDMVKLTGYRKSKNAPGSTVRMFYQYLSRVAPVVRAPGELSPAERRAYQARARQAHSTKALPMQSQRGMMDKASRQLAEVYETFLEMLPTMRRKELEKLIAKRPALWGRFAGYLTSGHVFVDDPVGAQRGHSTKKSPAQLDREIAEELSKSGKGPRPSKLGGDYFTVVLTRATPASTNEWNRLPVGWDSQTRGTFPTKYAAHTWAREKLLPGAPFTIRYVPLGQT